jgi:hypothetical protein
MKLNTKRNKLSLIALLSLGLACSPLVVNAADRGHGWSGHHQQDRGKPHHKTEYRSNRHDVGHRVKHGYRDSCRTDYKHIDKHDYKHVNKKVNHKYKSHGRGRYNDNHQPYYRDGYYSDSNRFFPESYFGNLAVLFYD